MSHLEFIAKIENGNIRPPTGLRPFMKENNGREVRIILSQNTRRRSLNQNSYYWAVVVPYVRQFRMDNGDTVSLEQAHEDLIEEFSSISLEYKTLSGVSMNRRKRTKEMSRQEMNDYITAITARLSEFGYHLPLEGDIK